MPDEKVRIDPSLIPDYAVNWACRLFYNYMKNLFSQPGVQEDYERWLEDNNFPDDENVDADEEDDEYPGSLG